jgi:hypothetical protein
MCEKTKKKIDTATILYKIFLISMIFTQVYPIVFGIILWEEIVIHGIISIYLLFRYYMLVRMRKRATTLDLTLTEFLQERENCVTETKC